MFPNRSIGEVADVSQSEVNYDKNGRMTSSQLLKRSDFRSLGNDKVCIASLNPIGEMGRDRLSITFAVSDRRVLIVSISDLLTNQVLIDQQAISKLE